MFKVHFICQGNVFRSRLAEAYLKSICSAGVKVTSSGVAANQNTDGPIGWYAAKIIKKNSLIEFASPNWTQTSVAILKEQQLVIFMTQAQLRYVKATLGFLPKSYQVWEIPDLTDFGYTSDDLSNKNLIASIKKSDQIFDQLKIKIAELIKTSLS